MSELQRALEVIVFPGPFNWPIFVAQEKGFFARNGLTVNITPTPDSRFQMVGLIDGKFDIAMTAVDNVVAYSEGQGAAPTQNEPDIFSFMGLDNGFLNLVSIPEVTRYAELRGKRIGVDALTTGYAFVLRKLLELGGLKTSDFEFVQAGGVLNRFQSLMNKEFAATLLTSPLDTAAESRGFNRIAKASEVLGAYQGAVGAARRKWASENRAQLVGYIRSYRTAIAWLCEATNKQEAIAILKKSATDVTDTVAEASYAKVLDPHSGLIRDLSIDVEGVRAVLALRTEYGEPRKILANPLKYYDTRYLDELAR